jgi:UDP-3-O-[3-hydroxymyristoyl] glucosamine N-acyltransferase
VVFGGQSGTVGHQTIGDRTMVAGKSAVHGDVGPDSRLSGVPAIDGQRWFKAVTLFGKLPELARDLRRMKKEVARLAAPEQAGSDKV